MDNQMDQCTIKFNRYKSEQFLNEWEMADKSGNMIVINDIEIKYDKKEAEQLIQEFLTHISDIDNEVQKFCKMNFERGKFNIENYIVDLAWVYVKDNIITLGYWGEYVNIELRAIYKFENKRWNLVDMYYQ